MPMYSYANLQGDDRPRLDNSHADRAEAAARRLMKVKFSASGQGVACPDKTLHELPSRCLFPAGRNRAP